MELWPASEGQPQFPRSLARKEDRSDGCSGGDRLRQPTLQPEQAAYYDADSPCVRLAEPHPSEGTQPTHIRLQRATSTHQGQVSDALSCCSSSSPTPLREFASACVTVSALHRM